MCSSEANQRSDVLPAAAVAAFLDHLFGCPDTVPGSAHHLDDDRHGDAGRGALSEVTRSVFLVDDEPIADDLDLGVVDATESVIHVEARLHLEVVDGDLAPAVLSVVHALIVTQSLQK